MRTLGVLPPVRHAAGQERYTPRADRRTGEETHAGRGAPSPGSSPRSTAGTEGVKTDVREMLQFLHFKILLILKIFFPMKLLLIPSS